VTRFTTYADLGDAQVALVTPGWVARPAARANFERLSAQNRYAILFRLHDAKRAETRARRLAQFVAMLEAGETIYP